MTGDYRAPGKSTIRVLVADNSRIYTRLLADALTRDPVLEVIPFESDPSGLVAAIMEQGIDVLVVSSNWGEHPSRGFEILHELRAARLNTRAVLLLDSSKDETVVKAFRAGARGVFGKHDSIDLLAKCVRCVYQSQIWANSQALSVAVEALASSPAVRSPNVNGMNLLSERELQVVHSVAEGLTNREIAERLKLSQHTVKNYLFRIFDKLGVSSRVELLFMTLTQAQAGQVSLHGPSNGIHNRNGYSDDEFELLQKAAEVGMPAAQLALAQLYLARGGDLQDQNIVQAYMWYLIATERALEARGLVTKMMTAKQIDEARQKASVWLSERKRTSSCPADPAPATGPARRRGNG